MVLALALAACAPDAEAIRTPSVEAELFPPREPVLLAAAGARHLPADTPVVVMVAAPALWIGAANLREETEPYDRGIEALARWATGLSLPEAKQIAAAGLDANGPWGMAWLDDASVVFGRVTDSRKLRVALRQAGLSPGANKIPRRCEDGATLHVVVRSELAYFVHSSDCDGAVAGRIADTSAEGGLAAKPAFHKHLERLSFGAHLSAYVQPSAWKLWTKGTVFDQLADEYRGRAELTKAIRRALDARSRAVQRVAKAIDGIALGVEIDDASLRIKAFIAGGDELITARSGRFPRIEDARFLFEGAIDPGLFRELFALLGHEPTDAELQLSEVGLSVEKDILPRLDGRIRMRSRPSSLVLRLGLRDATEARAFLRSWVERRRAKPPRSTRALTVSVDERVLRLRNPDLWLSIEGDELVAVRRDESLAVTEYRALPNPMPLARIDSPDAVLLVDAHLAADILERVENPFPSPVLRFGHSRFFTADQFFTSGDRFSGPRPDKHGELIRQGFGLASRQRIERDTGRERLLTALGKSALAARIVEGGVMLHGVQRLEEDDLSTLTEHILWAFADAAGTSDTGRQLAQLKRDILALER
jgi:hypothetical protein